MSFGASLVTAGLTTMLGFFAFVLGQLALKLVVEPIQEQARLVGKVTHALTYYRDVGRHSPPAGQPDPERIAESKRVYKELAAELRMNQRVIPWYWLFFRLPFVLSEERVRRASAALMVLSIIAHKDPAAEDVSQYRREVQVSLGIDP